MSYEQYLKVHHMIKNSLHEGTMCWSKLAEILNSVEDGDNASTRSVAAEIASNG